MTEHATSGDRPRSGVVFKPDGSWDTVLCNGMIRSGSTWSYNVALKLLRVAVGDAVYGDYNENAAAFLESVPPAVAYRVVKCHMLDGLARTWIESGKAKVIYTCRDLADAAASFMRMFDFDFDHTFSALQGALELYRMHRESGKALILGYQGIISRPLESIASISRYLDVAVSPEIVGRIGDQTSLDSARARVTELKSGIDADKLVRFDRFVHDRETLLNLDHIRDGSSGYGRALLTEEQLTRLDLLAKQYDFSPE